MTGTVTEQRFERLLRPGARLQVVVAHPDDETFGCGSLLLLAAAAGVTTAVCCATRGEAGEPAPGTTLPEGGLGVLRERELHDAAGLLGVGEVTLLGFRDSGMDGPADGSTLVGAAYDEVRDAVAAAVDGFAPDVVVTLDASDGHRDHARIRDAAVEVAAARGVPAYLHCLSRSTMERWAAFMAAGDPTSPYLSLGPLGTPDDQLTDRLDTTAHRDARWRAIRAHRSQTSPFEGLPDGLADEFLCTEHLMRVPVRG
ncbi:PIG-L deacetylase family protein [Nocardioides caldifontis]|uniref:PIG-L deacetylase family protein n=1 Tax=Nocardioides caldifontis TaxID=2588938 RepID=UPI0011E06A5A|nr:PIG-L family deacetylase [Nocardioides caldifontis]